MSFAARRVSSLFDTGAGSSIGSSTSFTNQSDDQMSRLASIGGGFFAAIAILSRFASKFQLFFTGSWSTPGEIRTSSRCRRVLLAALLSGGATVPAPERRMD